jgi:hypothetical protein
MESHPIPQQISSYQFRLVGDMTLKQFFQLGGGALFAILFYASHLHPIIKWPLVIFSFALGAALAFLPFEERPLSRWLVAFFTSVYSPTIFFWKKSEMTISYFLPEDSTSASAGTPLPASTLGKNEPNTKLDQNEQGFLAKIAGLFGQFNAAPAPAPTPTTNVPAQVIPKVAAVPLVVPEQSPVLVSPTQKSFRPKIVIEEEAPKETVTEQKVTTLPTTPVLTETGPSQGQQAQFSESAAPPIPPSIPNTISGQVFDDKGKIVEGAILEIRDLAGRPVRALRSNKVGHFLIVTALQNGQYDIVSEKEGLLFDPATFEAKGEIIPPIVLRAKGSTEVKNAPYTGKPLVIN